MRNSSDRADNTPRRIVIDGPSGAGKTTLANELGERYGLPVLHLDDWYPGWEGLAAGTRIAEELVTGKRESFSRWDWARNQVAQLVPVDLTNGWILEGCGALTPVTKDAADLTLWLELPTELARERGIARDGDSYAKWWDCWHQQELEHWRINQPMDLADQVIQVNP